MYTPADMKLLLRRLLWFSVGALLITALTSVAFDGVRSRSEHEIEQKREAWRLSREAVALATDRETGIRGYLLTHSPISLAPEVRARQLLPPILDSIGILSPNDATARARVDSLRDAIAQWEKGFANVAIREDAPPPGSGLAGKGLFDNIRVQFQALIGPQERQYRDMIARHHRIQLLDTGLTLFELAAFVGALLFFIRKRLIHQTDEMMHQQQLLEQQAIELEVQMQESETVNANLSESLYETAITQKTLKSTMEAKDQVSAFLEAALASSPIGFAFLDTNLRILRVNSYLAESRGLKPEDFIGRRIREVIPDGAEEIQSALERVLVTRKPIRNVEVVRPKVNGNGEHHSSASYYPIETPEGVLLGVGAVVEDVTEIVTQTRELQRSEERYRLVSQVTSDAVFEWDLKTDALYWNEGITGLFGYEKSDIVPHISWWSEHAHPDDSQRIMDSFVQAMKAGGSTWKSDAYLFRRKDGKYSTVTATALIMRGEDGVPFRVIGSISDRTREHALESQLRQSQKMEAIGRLAGGIAHDFNNILTVIRMSSEFLLADLPESDDKFQDATEIMRASDRAARLTRQLLAFSRHQILNPTVLSLNDVVGGMDGMVRRVLPENIELVKELASELRSIRADTGQMEQVLLNLVINAADAMPQGGKLSIRTSNAEVDSSFSAKNLDVPAGDYVCLTVSDTGIGMDQETVAKIFDPFFTTKGVGKGTGLGLSTVHGIVTQTGGKIWVYSELGLGTTFRVFLPRAEGTLTPTSSVVVHEDGAPPTETVLIVEDEEATRLAIHRNLSRVGYTVIDASNGVEGLRVAESYPGTIHLLLTDSMMPEMGGTELVRELRKNRPHINVLMMSGYTEDLAATLGDGQNEFFIEKPFNTVDLLAAIRSALSSASHLASPQDSTERDLS